MQCSLLASLLSPLVQPSGPVSSAGHFFHLLAASSRRSGVAEGHRKLGKVSSQEHHTGSERHTGQGLLLNPPHHMATVSVYYFCFLAEQWVPCLSVCLSPFPERL